MAYNRSNRRTTSRRSPARRTGYSRSPVRRRSVSKRSTARRAAQTIRIVVEQPSSSDVARPIIGQKVAIPRKRKF